MKQTNVNAVVIKSEEDRERYCQAVLALLRRIDVSKGDSTLTDDLKSVYELLNLLKGKRDTVSEN